MGLAAKVVDRLKVILRIKGVTYKTLAESLGMSEAAIKRAFSEQAFSLKRLDEICDVLQISVQEFFDLNDGEESLTRTLNDEQDLLLASDEKLLCFFYLITAKTSLSKIKQYYRFSDQEITRFLVKLDKTALIRLEADNKFKLLVKQDFYWQKGGLLNSYYGQEIKRDFINHSFSGPHAGEVFASGQLTESSMALISKRLRSLEDEVREMIRLDTQYRDGELKNVTLYCSYRPWIMPMMRKYRREFS